MKFYEENGTQYALVRGHYEAGGLYLQVVCAEDEQEQEEMMWQPYADLTVNLGGMPDENDEYVVYLNTNHLPGLEDKLEELGLGCRTYGFRQSGFCQYPEFALDREAVEEYILSEV